MAITIVETVSSASANSYQTLAAAQAIIDGLVEDDDVVAWSSATTDQKNRALVTATKRIDRERFIGAKANKTKHFNGQDKESESQTHLPELIQACFHIVLQLITIQKQKYHQR